MRYCYCGFRGSAREVAEHILRAAVRALESDWRSRTPVHREDA